MSTENPYFIDAGCAISMTSKFHILSENLNFGIETLVPVYPNESIINHTDTLNYLKYQFCVPVEFISNLSVQNLKLKHITEYFLKFEVLNGINVYINANYALIYIIRIADPVFINIFKFNTPEDLLYHIVRVNQELNLENENQNIQLFGSIAEDSQIIRLLKIYFSNVSSFN